MMNVFEITKWGNRTVVSQNEKIYFEILKY